VAITNTAIATAPTTTSGPVTSPSTTPSTTIPVASAPGVAPPSASSPLAVTGGQPLYPLTAGLIAILVGSLLIGGSRSRLLSASTARHRKGRHGH
jgi:hypothetical protein